MFPKTITITVTSAAEESLVEQALAMVRDLDELAGTAAAGQILDRCEEAAVEKGREFTRKALEQAVGKRLDAGQKKGRRCAAAGAADSANTKDSAKDAC
jgi:hypothetical protein